jgi:hypothetical protein
MMNGHDDVDDDDVQGDNDEHDAVDDDVPLVTTPTMNTTICFF